MVCSEIYCSKSASDSGLPPTGLAHLTLRLSGAIDGVGAGSGLGKRGLIAACRLCRVFCCRTYPERKRSEVNVNTTENNQLPSIFLKSSKCQ